MPRAIVFDVNETLLDLRALDPVFEGLFGEAAVRREWFGQLLQSALVATVTGAYRDFGAVGMGAREMVAAGRGVALTEEGRQAVKDGMRALPPHPEVRAALERLRDAGLRLAALTKSPARGWSWTRSPRCRTWSARIWPRSPSGSSSASAEAPPRSGDRAMRVHLTPELAALVRQ